MYYTIPDYYHQFHCIADQCEDTCCAGWQIMIDKKSLKKYKAQKGPYRSKLLHSINWQQSAFKQKEEKRCAFLNEDNFCDMYTNLGRDSLCKTCRLYPRHIEEFEGVREITLSLSCPEAARLLLSRKEPVRFLTIEKEGYEEYDNYDPFLYSQLVDARTVMLEILQDRTCSIEQRALLILGISHDMQIRVNHRELFSCQQVLDKYQSDSAKEFALNKIAHITSEDLFSFSKERLSLLEQLEFLRDDWYVHLTETQQRLYANNDAARWARISQSFFAWIDNSSIPWTIQKEQLLVYFISTYFCGAVYDGHLCSKVQMAITSVVHIEEMLKARWLRNEETLDMEDVIEIVYRYSREVEHSDMNLKKIERLTFPII